MAQECNKYDVFESVKGAVLEEMSTKNICFVSRISKKLII